MSTLYVVFEGKNYEGIPNPAAIYTSVAAAQADFNETVEEGLADLNTGLYLGQLDNLDDDAVNNVYQNLFKLADENFEGMEMTLLDSYGSSIEDWDDESLSVAGEEDYDSEDTFVVSRVVVGETRESNIALIGSTN